MRRQSQHRNPLNLSLYRLKADCYRRIRMSPEGVVKIIFKNSSGKEIILNDPQEIPSGDILGGQFPEDQFVFGTIYFNEAPIKTVKFALEEEEPEEEEPETQAINPQNNMVEFGFIRQLMSQQELLSELKFKSHAEITEIKLNGMKVQFEEMLKQKESIYMERLDIEREKVKLESGLETESVLMESFRNVLEQLTPLISQIAEAYIANKTIPQAPKIKRI
jgi:hypothetical protein